MMANSSSSFTPNISCGPCLYCGGTSKGSPEDLLSCQSCRRPAHIACLQYAKMRRQLIGDNFFKLTCRHCSPSRADIVHRGYISVHNAVLLMMYDLHMTKEEESCEGYFHYRDHVHSAIMKHWLYLYGQDPTMCKRKSKVKATTINFNLAQYPSIYSAKKKRRGYYKLIHIAPPAMLLSIGTHRKRARSPNTSTSSDHSPIAKKIKVDTDEVDVPEPISVPNFTREEVVEDTKDIEDNKDIKDVSSEMVDETSRGSWFTDRDLLRPFQKVPLDIFDDDDATDNISQPEVDQIDVESTSDDSESIKSSRSSSVCALKEPKEEYKEQVCDTTSGVSQNISSSPSLFTIRENVNDNTFNIEESIGSENLRLIGEYEERNLLHSLEMLNKIGDITPEQYRLRRKLKLRQEKRDHGLPIFDIDVECRFLSLTNRFLTPKERQIQRIRAEQCEDISCENTRILDRFYSHRDYSSYLQNSFRMKLLASSSGQYEPIHSPYTLRELKPFIYRDSSCVPLKLRLLNELVVYVNSGEPDFIAPQRSTIDYCYVTPKHIPAMNQMARQFFWPRIDLSEVLQYPDHTCVVLYKQLVIGFGILVPDVGVNEAYISFLLVHPEWRRAGIATFILYHLIQTSPGNDITLHTSATNPSLILYQQFGFKVEEFLTDFYDKYLPESSPECKHAMFMRLTR